MPITMEPDERSARSTANVTGRDRGDLPCWRPTTVNAVIDCVHRARREGLALYPVSTGLNWGYGSASPPQPGCVLLDLGGMNRIRNAAAISSRQPVAVIEPGVTQRQLHEFLQAEHPELSFNVTGSSADTSILGNALDRGVGYLGPRREDVFGLEVVTGTGELLRTGFRRLGEQSPLAHAHPYGLGPMLDGLFFQGNLGIVTSACFRLLPRPARSVAVSLALRDAAQLGAFLDALFVLKRTNVVDGVTHVGNRARTRASMAAGIGDYLQAACGVAPGALGSEIERALATVAPHEWTSLGSVSGSAAQVRAALAEVRRVVGGLARVTVVDDAKLAAGLRLLHPLRGWSRRARAHAAAIAAIRPLHGLADRRPTDAAIANLLWRAGQTQRPALALDASDTGLLFVNPALPADGRGASDAMAALHAVARSFGHTLYVTLNIEGPTSLVAVANLRFDRADPDAVETAHACADALWACLRARGLEVYRARADMMERLADPTDPHWRTAWQLKAVFDPDHVIAPGRYNLARAPQG